MDLEKAAFASHMLDGSRVLYLRDYVLARRACQVESMPGVPGKPGSPGASLMIAVGAYADLWPRALYLERPHLAAYTSLGSDLS